MKQINLDEDEYEYEILNFVFNKGYIARKGSLYGALSIDKSKIVLDFKYHNFDDVCCILNDFLVPLPPELAKLDDISYINNDDRIRYRDMLENGTSADTIIEDAKKISEARRRGLENLNKNIDMYHEDREAYSRYLKNISCAITEKDIETILQEAEEFNSFCEYKSDAKDNIERFINLFDKEKNDFYHQIKKAKTKTEIDEILQIALDLDCSRNDLYQFLFDALSHDELSKAIQIAEKRGCKVEELSKVSRKLLENYNDLASVENLYNVDFEPLVNATYNPAFIEQLLCTLRKNYFKYYSVVLNSTCEKDLNCIENPIDRVQYEMYRAFGSRLPYNLFAFDTNALRIKRASENQHPWTYYFNSYNLEQNLEQIENIKSLLFNDWSYMDIFGEPTGYEIYCAASSIEHPGLQKYVLRNYKDILQSTWYTSDSTFWNQLREKMKKIQYSKKDIRLVNTFLLIRGWTINDDGMLINLKGKPVELDIKFPPAKNLIDDPKWVNNYGFGAEYIGGLLFDAWPQEFYKGKAPELWRIRKYVAKMRHPGIMKFVLAKYKAELKKDKVGKNDKSLYEILCEDIAKVEANPEDYEHLTRLYDTILSDNNIDIENLTEQLLRENENKVLSKWKK